MIKIGAEGYLYRNTGTYAVPVWSEIDKIGDVTMPDAMDKAPATTRASGKVKEVVPSLREISFGFQIRWDTDDLNFKAILAAYLARTSLEIVALDGPVEGEGSAGSFGPRGTVCVTQCARNQALGDVLVADVLLEPTPSDHPFEWFEVSAS